MYWIIDYSLSPVENIANAHSLSWAKNPPSTTYWAHSSSERCVRSLKTWTDSWTQPGQRPLPLSFRQTCKMHSATVTILCNLVMCNILRHLNISIRFCREGCLQLLRIMCCTIRDHILHSTLTVKAFCYPTYHWLFPFFNISCADGAFVGWLYHMTTLVHWFCLILVFNIFGI